MEFILHPSTSRGTADFGWLKSRHSFSFGHYYNPERMGFGALRVLNDDRVAAGAGFGTHPHNNMEIISIALQGDLQHRDSMGNTSVIRENEIQVMSAGSGITHSEMNASREHEVEFLQIWIIPDERNVLPRYDQVHIDREAIQNRWATLVAPRNHDGLLWIHQDAWLSMSAIEAGVELNYALNSMRSGVYAFIIEGVCEIQNFGMLNRRDAACIWNTESLTIQARSHSKILLIEIPLTIH
jgi:redox-sensitive bicupin YhaK (pirin superfamily)